MSSKREIMATIGKKRIKECPRIEVQRFNDEKWMLIVEAFDRREKIEVIYRPASQRWKGARPDSRIKGQGISTLFSYFKLEG